MRIVPVLPFCFIAASAAFIACGEPTTPVPPPAGSAIVKLLVADPDTGFWLGGSISLSSLVTGAVTEDGDTIPAPPVTWSIPAGFVRTGDLLTATREARGALVPSISAPASVSKTAAGTSHAGAVSASIQISSLDNLATRRWGYEYRCYSGKDAQGNLVTDSTWVTMYGGEISYDVTPWPGVFYAFVRPDSQRVIHAWAGGAVDTLINRNASQQILVQDTLATGLYLRGDTTGVAAQWTRRVSDSPVIYRLDAPGVCPSATWASGSAFELRESR